MLRVRGALGWGLLLVLSAACAPSTPRVSQPAPVAEPPQVESTEPIQRQAAPPPPAPDRDETVVKFAFKTTAAAVVPGSTFWLAAYFRMPPGYRIFWLNPGDMGRPTEVRFSVPEGFEISETRFPAPQQFELPDAGVSYGYVGQTAAFAQVRPSPDLDSSRTYRIEVQANWLACNERCYPEHTNAFVEFGVDPTAQNAPFETSLAELLETLPQPLTELAGATYRWKRGGRLHVSAGATKWLGFLPERPSDPKLVEVGLGAKKSELKLRFEDGTPGSRVKGLAIASAPEGVDYITLDIPWPVKAEKTGAP